MLQRTSRSCSSGGRCYTGAHRPFSLGCSQLQRVCGRSQRRRCARDSAAAAAHAEHRHFVPPQEMRLHELLQLLRPLLAEQAVALARVFGVALLDDVAELPVELPHVAQQAGLHEVEQRPQLHQIVLNGRAREQQTVLHRQLSQRLRRLDVVVLQLVAFVCHDIVPRHRAQLLRVVRDHVVGCDEYAAPLAHALQLRTAFLRRTLQFVNVARGLLAPLCCRRGTVAR